MLQKSWPFLKNRQSFLTAPFMSTFNELSLYIWIMITFKAGIIEEMLEDTMEGLEDQEELEEEVQVITGGIFSWPNGSQSFYIFSHQTEVDKILAELTDGKLGEAPTVPEGSLAGPSKPQVRKMTKQIIKMMIHNFCFSGGRGRRGGGWSGRDAE